MGSEMNIKIKKTEFTEDELIFTTIRNDLLKFYASGDCCSHSYIESIDDISVLQDCEILRVTEERGETKEVDDFNYIKWTFYKFKTNKGVATLSFRNESNGYYNGCLEASDETVKKYGELFNCYESIDEILKKISAKDL